MVLDLIAGNDIYSIFQLSSGIVAVAISVVLVSSFHCLLFTACRLPLAACCHNDNVI